MALEHAGMTVGEMAAKLHVTRNTVSRWMHDRSKAPAIYMREWAQLCGVDHAWLVGEEPGTTMWYVSPISIPA